MNLSESCEISGRIMKIYELQKVLFLKPTQYKKLAPHALWFTYDKTKQKHQYAKSIGEKLKIKGLMFFLSFFHVIYKVSNFDM